MPLAREGHRLIAAAAALTLLALVLGWTIVTLVALLVTLFFLNFFRDPDRLTPPGAHLITSPADGKVVAVCHRSTCT